MNAPVRVFAFSVKQIQRHGCTLRLTDYAEAWEYKASQA